ncbi:unnamed protein product [Phaedon cochleariae]|uniref:Uncharacterized protein n=1 Tax=Phaedon cochleariae TaxID=80249 RepID=A0A9N9SFH0_PHACE|nr:unnamed protein product [Phaedon cochleariae]
MHDPKHTQQNLIPDCESCKAWENHISKAKNAREKYRTDAANAGSDETSLIVSADLEKVIMLPRIMFKQVIFCQRIIVFNESFVPIGKKQQIRPFSCLWHECISGRKKEDLISTFHAFLIAMRDFENITFWLDNCSGQNKNWALFSYLTYIINSPEGHTFMAADSFHHQMELSLQQKKKVYDFADFVNCVQTANSGKVTVKLMNLEDFFVWPDNSSSHNIKQLIPRPYMKDIVEVIAEKGKNELIYRTSFDAEAIKSDPTVRKIKSEAMAQWDKDSNDLINLIRMQMDHEEYIQEVCIPFNVKIYSQEQFQVIDKSRVDNDLPILYFDATGSIVKKPEGVKKRIYLYTAVIPTYPRRIFPVFEMISATHFAKTIYKIFNDFRCLCEENNKWPTFGAIVTDSSFPNLHAVSKSCNRCTLLEHIARCYSIVKGEIIFTESLVTIHLCCAHLIKIFSKDIEEKFADRSDANFLKDAMALAINTQTLAQLEDWFINMAVILLSQFATERVYRSQKCISNGIEDMNEGSVKEANTLKSGNIYNEDDTEK